MIENTDIIAGEPHVLQSLVDPYPGDGKSEAASTDGMLALLQKQLQAARKKDGVVLRVIHEELDHAAF